MPHNAPSQPQSFPESPYCKSLCADGQRVRKVRPEGGSQTIWSPWWANGDTRGLTYIAVPGFSPGRNNLWRTWRAELVRLFLWRIIRASFSQERMTYIQEAGQVVYQSKSNRRRLETYTKMNCKREKSTYAFIPFHNLAIFFDFLILKYR